ncbi:MAG: GYF domain-containing protein, partial [Phycisphaerae bacterium]
FPKDADWAGVSKGKGTAEMTQPPPPNDKQWYYLVNGQRLGPVDTATLQSMLRQGSVTGSTPVWREGMSNWESAGTLPEFSFAPVDSSRKEAFLGLNQNGLILFIVLLAVFPILCWLPFVIDSCKAEN